MATYKRADDSVQKMASRIIKNNDCYAGFRDRKIQIDYMFAYGERDDENPDVILSPAIMHHGHQASGLCRKLSLKDRAAGRADAEILLDGDWWKDAEEADRVALLDHELYHIIPTDKMDDLGRPVLKLRKHDVEVGWFVEIAKRHGVHSMERKQASAIANKNGQYFWPELFGHTADLVERAAASIRRTDMRT